MALFVKRTPAVPAEAIFSALYGVRVLSGSSGMWARTLGRDLHSKTSFAPVALALGDDCHPQLTEDTTSHFSNTKLPVSQLSPQLHSHQVGNSVPQHPNKPGDRDGPSSGIQETWDTFLSLESYFLTVT